MIDRWWRRILGPPAVVLVGLGAVVGCGPRDAEEPAVGAVGSMPLEVPVALSPSYFDGYWEVVATAGHLVGVGGMAPMGSPVEEVYRRDGMVVDLTTGAVTSFEVPALGDGFVVSYRAAADDEAVVVMGGVCEAFEIDGTCAPATAASYRFDPEELAWTSLALPPEVEGRRVLSAPLVQPLVGGGFVATVSLLDGHTDDLVQIEELVVLRSSGDGWDHVASLGTERPWKTCATVDALYALTVLAPMDEGPGSGDPGAAETWLVEVGLEDGRVEPVELPPLATGFGGAGIAFGCGPDGPVVASGTPAVEEAPGMPSSVHRLAEGEWVEVEGALGGEGFFPGEVETGPHGVVVGGFAATGADGVKPLSWVALDRHGAVTPLDPELAWGTSSVWRGRTGRMLLIEGGSGDEDEVITPTVTVDEIEVWP